MARVEIAVVTASTRAPSASPWRSTVRPTMPPLTKLNGGNSMPMTAVAIAWVRLRTMNRNNDPTADRPGVARGQ